VRNSIACRAASLSWAGFSACLRLRSSGSLSIRSRFPLKVFHLDPEVGRRASPTAATKPMPALNEVKRHPVDVELDRKISLPLTLMNELSKVGSIVAAGEFINH
jgi:hypothetical protein